MNLRLSSGKTRSGLLFALLFFSLSAFLPARRLSAAPSAPHLGVSKTVTPNSIDAGGKVEYTIEIENTAGVAAADVVVIDMLPDGFSYVTGSSRVTINGGLAGSTDPSINGRELTWSDLRVSAQRSGSFFGVHTFVQDRCEPTWLNWQLDRALELMGPGAWVKQLFLGINPGSTGPASCWIDFVNGAYDRGLRPVLRLQGDHAGSYWHKPHADSPNNYDSIAAAYKRVVAGLPRRDGHQLLVEVWNEPNLNLEWSNAANATEYGHFLVQVAQAIRSIGDNRILVINGGLSPGGEIQPMDFIDQMVSTVPASLWAWDVWSTHPYPGNHPPEYNNHDGTAVLIPQLAIDTYMLEVARLEHWGRHNIQVLLTETGYDLGNSSCGWEGYATINEGNRADYISRAFRDYWSAWPEVIGATPYQLSDPWGTWTVWDWISPGGGQHQQYGAVQGLNKSTPDVPGTLTITFEARTPDEAGTYLNDVQVTASNTTVPPLYGAAPVTVIGSGPTPTPTISPTPTVTPTITPTPTPVADVVTTVPVGNRPHGLAVDTDRDLIFVANHLGGNVTVVDGSVDSVIDTLPLGGSSGSNGIAFDAGKRRLYIANKETDDLARVDADGGPVDRTTIGHQPDGVAVQTGGSLVYAANFSSNSLSVVDGSSGAQVVAGPTGSQPSMVAYHPVTNKVYVTNHGSHTVGVHGGTSGALLSEINVGGGPYGIALDVANNKLYTANREGHSVSVIDTTRDAAVHQIPMNCTPYIVEVNSNTGHLFAVCAETQQVHIYDTSDYSWLAWLPVGQGAGEGITLNPVTNRVYIANSDDDTLTVIQDGGAAPEITPTPTRTSTPTSSPRPTATPTATVAPPTATPTATAGVPVICLPDAWEPDDDPLMASWITANGGLQYHNAHHTDDGDWLRFWAEGGKTYALETNLLGTQANTSLSLYDSDFATLLAHNDDCRGEARSCLTWRARASGSYYVLTQSVVPLSHDCEGYDYFLSLEALNSLYLPLITQSPGVTASRGVAARLAPAQQAPVQDAGSLLVNPDTGWLVAAYDGTLTITDPQAGRTVARSPIGHKVKGLAIDQPAQRLFLATWDPGRVTMFDAHSGKQLAESPSLRRPSGIAVVAGQVYVAETAADRLLVLDSESLVQVSEIRMGPAPYSLAADPESERLYVTLAGSDMVATVDTAEAMVVASTKLGGLGLPQDVAVDASAGRVYVTYLLSPRYRNVAVLDAESGDLVDLIPASLTMPLAGAQAVQVDGADHRLYVSDNEGIQVFSTHTLQWLETIEARRPANPFDLSLNQALGVLYSGVLSESSGIRVRQ